MRAHSCLHVFWQEEGNSFANTEALKGAPTPPPHSLRTYAKPEYLDPMQPHGESPDCAPADKQQSYSRINNIFMELRKCCNHPYLLKGVEADNPALRGATPAAVVDAMVKASGKLALIDRMFARLKARGHRTLIYSQVCLRCTFNSV